MGSTDARSDHPTASHAEGFSRMDVSTSIHLDPKFRLLTRRHPDLAPTAVAAYLMLLAESWREGDRLTLEEAWTLFPFDEAAARAMKDVKLVDDEGRIPDPTWLRYFGAAVDRRDKSRERQKRADAKRGRTADTSSRPALSRPALSRPALSGSSASPALDQQLGERIARDRAMAVAATQRKVHRYGGHEEERNPACDLCAAGVDPFGHVRLAEVQAS